MGARDLPASLDDDKTVPRFVTVFFECPPVMDRYVVSRETVAANIKVEIAMAQLTF